MVVEVSSVLIRERILTANLSYWDDTISNQFFVFFPWISSFCPELYQCTMYYIIIVIDKDKGVLFHNVLGTFIAFDHSNVYLFHRFKGLLNLYTRKDRHDSSYLSNIHCSIFLLQERSLLFHCISKWLVI